MNFFKNLFVPREIKIAVGILDELEYKFKSNAFKIVREDAEKMIFNNSSEFVKMIKRGVSPRQWLLGVITNRAGDHLESGQYHIYRGYLNPFGHGSDLLKIYDQTIDESAKIGSHTIEFAEKQKNALRVNIEKMG